MIELNQLKAARTNPIARWRWAMVLLCALAMTVALSSARAQGLAAQKLTPQEVAAPTCGDFLSQANAAIAHLEYVGCKRTNSAQLRVLETTYRVQGPQAQQVYRQLQRRYSLKPLRFVCCVWETRPVVARLSKTMKQPFEIQMGSEETVYGKKHLWPKVEFFYVTVTYFLDEP